MSCVKYRFGLYLSGWVAEIETGTLPLLIVGAAGTVGVGAIDPSPEITDIEALPEIVVRPGRTVDAEVLQQWL